MRTHKAAVVVLAALMALMAAAARCWPRATALRAPRSGPSYSSGSSVAWVGSAPAPLFHLLVRCRSGDVRRRGEPVGQEGTGVGASKDNASSQASDVATQTAGAAAAAGSAATIRPKKGPPPEEEVDTWTYFFGKPGELQRDLALIGFSPTRSALAGLLAVVVGLTANLWGQTEFFLSVFPPAGQAAIQLHLDSIYAVNGLRGYYEQQYQLRYPGEWFFDQRIALAKFGQLEPEMLRTNGPKGGPSRAPSGVFPDGAWGPAGGGQRPLKDRENLSVVKQLLPPKADGTLADIEEVLGEPSASLQWLLTNSIAPAGSKKTAEPLRAARLQKSEAGSDGARSNVYYEYEWRTSFEAGFALRSYSSAAVGPPDARGNRFIYTLTAVLPEGEAASGQGAAALMPRILESFRVASS